LFVDGPPVPASKATPVWRSLIVTTNHIRTHDDQINVSHLTRRSTHICITEPQSQAAVDNKALCIPWNSQAVQWTAKLMLLNHTEPRIIVESVFQHRTPAADAVDAVLSVTTWNLGCRAGGNRLASQDF